MRKHCFFGDFPCRFSKRQVKEDQGMWTMAKLEVLNLRENQFSGCIPDALRSWTRLRSFNTPPPKQRWWWLHCSIPDGVGSWTHMQDLRLEASQKTPRERGGGGQKEGGENHLRRPSEHPHLGTFCPHPLGHFCNYSLRDRQNFTQVNPQKEFSEGLQKRFGFQEGILTSFCFSVRFCPPPPPAGSPQSYPRPVGILEFWE